MLTSQMIPGATPEEGSTDSPSRAAASAPDLLRSTRCIAAVDMDCFYAQCEELRRPELKGKPVGVQQKMLVITSNYAARAFGIQKGDSLKTVKEKCPEITICNGEDLSFYTEVSQQVFDTAARWTPKIEKLGLDEIFVDLTDLVADRLSALAADDKPASLSFGGAMYPGRDEPEAPWEFNYRRDWQGLDEEGRCRVRLALAAGLCAEIRDCIRREVGLTSSAGVSVSKLLAKMVASWRKPAQQTAFVPAAGALRALFPDSLQVNKIPGIGFSMTQRCRDLGIHSIGDFLSRCELPSTDQGRQALRTAFDEKATTLISSLCMARDDAEVKCSGPPKSCSVEDSFWQTPLRSDAQVTASLDALARKLLSKIRVDSKRFGARTVPTLAVCVRHSAQPGEPEGARREQRERRQMHLDGKLVIGGVDPTTEGSAERAAADEIKVRSIVERAFSLFRKMVPREPFAINILNLQVTLGEALPASQRQLSFAPTPSAASAPSTRQAAPRTTTAPERGHAAASPSRASAGSRASATVTSPTKAKEFFTTSRLSFIGTWRTRFRRFMRELLAEKAEWVGKGDTEFAVQLRGLPREMPASAEHPFVFHVDIDCFFVSVAAGPKATGPIAVTSGRSDTSEVCSANYEARKFGLCGNMFVKEALARCPALQIITTTPELFEQLTDTSREVYRILLQITERIEPMSCDEMYLQFPPPGPGEPPRPCPEALARALRQEVLRTTGCPVSIGIGHSTVVARWATRRAKPPGSGVCYIPQERAQEELRPCPASSLSGVGATTASRLEAMGARTCGDVQALPTGELQKTFGAALGLQIAAMARGEDPREIHFDIHRHLAERPKSMQNDCNWAVRLTKREEAEHMINEICGHLAERLQGEDPPLHAGRLKLIVRQRQPGAPEPGKVGGQGLCDVWSRADRLLPGGAGDAPALFGLARRLFAAFDAPPTEIRGLGVCVSQLTDATAAAQPSPLSRWLRPGAGPAVEAGPTASGRLAAPGCAAQQVAGPDTYISDASDGERDAPVEQACSTATPSGPSRRPSIFAARGSPAGSTPDLREAVRDLCAMGFDAAEAEAALRRAGGQVAGAVDLILQARAEGRHGPPSPGCSTAPTPKRARLESRALELTVEPIQID